MATNKLKFGTETPSKLYMGATEVTKAYMGETLVYETSEQDALAGTWVFNDEPNIESDLFLYKNYQLSFISNNKNFINILYYGSDINSYLQYSAVESINVYAYNSDAGYSVGWTDEAYKTINIISKLSEVTNGDQLLAWLQANATKQ